MRGHGQGRLFPHLATLFLLIVPLLAGSFVPLLSS